MGIFYIENEFWNLLFQSEILYISTLKKRRLKITQFENVRFIKVNELKLTQVEIFTFFHFMCAAANESELFCMAHLAVNERFLCHSKLSFQI